MRLLIFSSRFYQKKQNRSSGIKYTKQSKRFKEFDLLIYKQEIYIYIQDIDVYQYIYNIYIYMYIYMKFCTDN